MLLLAFLALLVIGHAQNLYERDDSYEYRRSLHSRGGALKLAANAVPGACVPCAYQQKTNLDEGFAKFPNRRYFADVDMSDESSFAPRSIGKCTATKLWSFCEKSKREHSSG